MGKSYREKPESSEKGKKKSKQLSTKKYKANLQSAELEYELYLTRMKLSSQGF